MKQYNIEDIRAAQNEAQALIAALEILIQSPEHASLERIRTHRDGTYNAVNKALGTKKRGSYKMNSQLLTAARREILQSIFYFVAYDPNPGRTQVGEIVNRFGLPLADIKALLHQLEASKLISYDTKDEAVELADGVSTVSTDDVTSAFCLAFDAPLLQEK